MFRRLILFVFLALALTVMVPAAPAQAQGCNPGCLLVRLWTYCVPAAVPPVENNLLAEIKYHTGNYSYFQPLLEDPGTYTMPPRRYRYFNQGALTGSYSVRWTHTSGPFAYWWSGWVGPQTVNSGGATVFQFHHYNHSC